MTDDLVSRREVLAALDLLRVQKAQHDEGEAWADGVGWAAMRVEQADPKAPDTDATATLAQVAAAVDAVRGTNATAAEGAIALAETLETIAGLVGDVPWRLMPGTRNEAVDPHPPRHWMGEATAAFDQSLADLPDGDFGDPQFWIARASAAAAIASAEQQRVANLIAWKQLQATRQAAADQGVGMMPLDTADTVTRTIERTLGIDA